MRKLLLVVLMILIGTLAFVGVTKGISLGSAELISPYTTITESSEKLNRTVESLNKISEVDFASKQTMVKTSYEKLRKAKEEYEDKLVFVTANEAEESNILNSYDITFLITRIGKIATQNGLVIDLKVIQNTTAQEIANVNYKICDLSFTAVGTYIGITDFVYALEDDEQLEFPIQNFKLVPNGENLCATFTIPEVPIKSENLITTDDSSNGGNISNNTPNDNTTTSNNNNTVAPNNNTNTVVKNPDENSPSDLTQTNSTSTNNKVNR